MTAWQRLQVTLLRTLVEISRAFQGISRHFKCICCRYLVTRSSSDAILEAPGGAEACDARQALQDVAAAAEQAVDAMRELICLDFCLDLTT